MGIDLSSMCSKKRSNDNLKPLLNKKVIRKLSFHPSKELHSNFLVGLCNPGTKYSGTRHNIGGRFIEHLAEKHSKSLKNASFGDYFETENAIYIRSLTYMNISGGNLTYLEKEYHVSLVK